MFCVAAVITLVTLVLLAEVDVTTGCVYSCVTHIVLIYQLNTGSSVAVQPISRKPSTFTLH